MVQVYPNSTALVVSTENITQNWYFGEERSMLIPNCLFRIGGAAMVLSNKCERPPPPPPPHTPNPPPFLPCYYLHAHVGCFSSTQHVQLVRWHVCALSGLRTE